MCELKRQKVWTEIVTTEVTLKINYWSESGIISFHHISHYYEALVWITTVFMFPAREVCQKWAVKRKLLVNEQETGLPPYSVDLQQPFRLLKIFGIRHEKSWERVASCFYMQRQTLPLPNLLFLRSSSSESRDPYLMLTWNEDEAAETLLQPLLQPFRDVLCRKNKRNLNTTSVERI